MDRFTVSINQVNFEKQTLDGDDINDLYSFSNLVSYDSEFKDGDGVEHPLVPRKLSLEQSKRQHNFLSSADTTFYNKTDKRDDKHHHHHHSSSSSSSSAPSADNVLSFRAFTETVEALALQQSVIGSSKVTPASEEEVARVVMEMKKKMVKKGVRFSEELNRSNNNHIYGEYNVNVDPIHGEGAAADDYVNSSVIKHYMKNRELNQGDGDQSEVLNGTNVINNKLISGQGDDIIIKSSSSLPLSSLSSGQYSSSSDVDDHTYYNIIYSTTDGDSDVRVDNGNNLNGRDDNGEGGDGKEVYVKEQDGSLKRLIRIPSNHITTERQMKNRLVWGPTNSDVFSNYFSKKSNKNNSPSMDQNMKMNMNNNLSSSSNFIPANDKDISTSQTLNTNMFSIFNNGIRDGNESTNDALNIDDHTIDAIYKVDLKSKISSEEVAELVERFDKSLNESLLEDEDGAEFNGRLKLKLNENITSENVTKVENVINVKSSSAVDHSLDDRFIEVCKEKANLEGRMEILKVENKQLLDIKVQLMAKLNALSHELHMKSDNVHKDEHANMLMELESLRTEKNRLESVILDAHKLITEKDDDAHIMTCELNNLKDVNDKMEKNVADVKQELQSRDVIIRDLKTKITELYVEFQTTNQNKILSENEVTSLSGELKAALASKEWYKDQLAICQKDKSDLQNEVTSTKAEMIRQATTIEKLKVENVRTKLHLNEVEQRLLAEKQSLARHLEAIEMEMMQREASILQANKEYLTVVKATDARDGSANAEEDEDDRTKMKMLVEELEDCKMELLKLRTMHDYVVADHGELQKKCASLQCNLDGRDKQLEGAEADVSTLREEVERLRLKVKQGDDRLDVVLHEKAVIEMDLTSTREEKKVIDDALASLKDNLKVIETNFHLMKVDLVAKIDEVTLLKQQLESSRQQIANNTQQLPQQHSQQVEELKPQQTTFVEIPNGNFEFPSYHIQQSSVMVHSKSDKKFVDREMQTVTSNQTDDVKFNPQHQQQQLDQQQQQQLQQQLMIQELSNLKVEKENVDKRLQSVTDQLKFAQDKHKHQLTINYAVECELEVARKEIDELKRKIKTSNDNNVVVTGFVDQRASVVANNNLQHCPDTNEIIVQPLSSNKNLSPSSSSSSLTKFNQPMNDVVKDKSANPTLKSSSLSSSSTHLRGIDIRDVVSHSSSSSMNKPDDDDDDDYIVNQTFISPLVHNDVDSTINHNKLIVDSVLPVSKPQLNNNPVISTTTITTTSKFNSLPESQNNLTANQSSIDSQFINNNVAIQNMMADSSLASRCKELEEELTELKVKLIQAEEQRNKVLLLEDQLDQSTQDRCVMEMQYRQQVESLTSELASHEFEIERLRDELTMLQFQSDSLNNMEDLERRRMMLLNQGGVAKFHGARFFEKREIVVEQDQQQYEMLPKQQQEQQQQQQQLQQQLHIVKDENQQITRQQHLQQHPQLQQSFNDNKQENLNVVQSIAQQINQYNQQIDEPQQQLQHQQQLQQQQQHQEQQQQHLQLQFSEEIKNLKSQLEKQRIEKESIELKLKSLSEKHDELTLVKNDLTNELKQLQQQLQQHIATIGTMNDRRGVLETHLLSSINQLQQVNEENNQLKSELVRVVQVSQQEIDRYKKRVVKLEVEIEERRVEQNKMLLEVRSEVNIEVEKERGRLMEMMNAQQSTSNQSLNDRELSSSSSDKSQQDIVEELQRRDVEIEMLRGKLMSSEENVEKQRVLLKDNKKALLTEKGNNVKLKLDVEEMLKKNNQLMLDVDSIKQQLETVSTQLEHTLKSESSLKVEVEKLQVELKFKSTEEQRMLRMLDDMRNKEATLLDQIKTLEWKLSQKMTELEASEERMVLVNDRHTCEINALTDSFKSKSSELLMMQNEMSLLSRERGEMKARIVQLKQAIADILAQHSVVTEKETSLVSELIINKQELEKLLVDVMPHTTDNKPLYVLQTTLSSLRGEIDSLQVQVNEHATAAMTSSKAWRDLEVQVQDLRQICQSSAASRAEYDKFYMDDLNNQSTSMTSPSSLSLSSSLQLPEDITSLASSLQLPENIASLLIQASSSLSSSSTASKHVAEETGVSEFVISSSSSTAAATTSSLSSTFSDVQNLQSSSESLTMTSAVATVETTKVVKSFNVTSSAVAEGHQIIRDVISL